MPDRSKLYKGAEKKPSDFLDVEKAHVRLVADEPVPNKKESEKYQVQAETTPLFRAQHAQSAETQPSLANHQPGGLSLESTSRDLGMAARAAQPPPFSHSDSLPSSQEATSKDLGAASAARAPQPVSIPTPSPKPNPVPNLDPDATSFDAASICRDAGPAASPAKAQQASVASTNNSQTSSAASSSKSAALSSSASESMSASPGGSKSPESLLSSLRKQVSPDEDKLIGASLPGGLKIVSRIGDGGMGSVYMACQVTLDRNVAVKVMHGNLLSNRKAINRFNQEAHAAARLDHPNIVKVHDFRADESGLCFLVMDLVEGTPLAREIRVDGKLSHERAINILAQVCDALHHAHSKGVVHRDLKPSNIMVAKNEAGEDYIRVLDFGIAKILPEFKGEGLKLTQTGEIFGSPFYMSPEQCKGNPADHRSDIYSMGCVIFETLTGKVPIEGTNAFETLCKHNTDMAPSIKKLRPDLEYYRELDAIILKAMAKNPAERYQSMLELKADLQKIGKKDETWFEMLSNEARLVNRKLKARSGRLIPYTVLSGCLGAGLLAVSAAFFIQSHQMGGDWNQLYVQAQQSVDRGDYQRAKQQFEQALRASGKDFERRTAVLMQIADLEHIQGLPPNSTYDKELKSLQDSKVDTLVAELAALDQEAQTIAANPSSAASDNKLEEKANEINDAAKQLLKGSTRGRTAAEKSLTRLAEILESRKLTGNSGYARTLHNLGFVALLQENPPKAVSLFKKAADVWKQSLSSDVTNLPKYLTTLEWCANALSMSGNAAEAEQFLNERLKLSRKTGSSYGALQNRDVARSYYLLAAHFIDSDIKKSERYIKQALVAYQGLKLEDERERGDCYTLLAMINLNAGNTKDAALNYDRAREIFESLPEQDGGYYLKCLIGLAEIHATQKDVRAAEPLYRHALIFALRTKRFAHSVFVDRCVSKLQEIYSLNGSTERLAVLASILKGQLADDIAENGAESREVLDDYVRLSGMARACNDMKTAASYLDKACEVAAKAYGENSWESLDMLVARGTLQFDSRQPEKGRKSFEKAISIAESLKSEAPKHRESLSKLMINVNQRLKDSPELIERVKQLTARLFS